MKKLLLVRANEQRAGHRITRPRSLNALPIMPEQVASDSSFASWSEARRDHWVNRIGNLALSQANDKQIAGLASYTDRRDRMLLSASSKRFPLTAELADIADCTPQTLQYRQDETVRLIADYWNIRYDAERNDLSTLSEESLQVTDTSTFPTSKRVIHRAGARRWVCSSRRDAGVGSAAQGRTLGGLPSPPKASFDWMTAASTPHQPQRPVPSVAVRRD